MRSLLESSSWMKFGPAWRGSMDWVPGPSALPSIDSGEDRSSEALSAGSITSIVVGCLSFLFLFLALLFILLWRRRRGLGLDGKLGLAGVIALEDLQDPERNCELLSSLRRTMSQRSQRSQHLPTSVSEQDVNDGVFLMVYLPSPYEQTLTRIARAASMSSSKDGDIPPSPGLDPPPSPGLDPPPNLGFPETGVQEKEEGKGDKEIQEA